jgi:hypothetical protein
MVIARVALRNGSAELLVEASRITISAESYALELSGVIAASDLPVVGAGLPASEIQSATGRPSASSEGASRQEKTSKPPKSFVVGRYIEDRPSNPAGKRRRVRTGLQVFDPRRVTE